MARDGEITVLLPVGPGFDGGALRRALASMAGQTRRPERVLVLGNGLSSAERAAVDDVGTAGGTGGEANRVAIQTVWLERAGLAAALNEGLRRAHTGLVARMDADDWSHPSRLAVQSARMASEPGLAGVGCAWEVAGVDGRTRAMMRPPTDAGRLAWTLLLGNAIAHGSMLLRRDAVLEAGGYDESLARAQDYELWLRMTRRGLRLGAVGDMLYRYVERSGEGVRASSAQQADAMTSAMIAAWSALPAADDRTRRELELAVSQAWMRENGSGVAEGLAVLLDAGATREGLMAMLWARDKFPPGPRRAMEAGRRARVREVSARMREAGATRVWLWGAGEHTRRVLEHPDDLGMPVAGLVDDAAGGEARHGHVVAKPGRLMPGDHVLLSSDWFEGTMWQSSAAARDRGVRVWRLYED